MYNGLGKYVGKSANVFLTSSDEASGEKKISTECVQIERLQYVVTYLFEHAIRIPKRLAIGLLLFADTDRVRVLLDTLR